MSELEPVVRRQLVVPVQVVLETDDPTVQTSAIVAELEAAVVLPETLDVGDGVTVVGGITGLPLEFAVAPEVTPGAYGR